MSYQIQSRAQVCKICGLPRREDVSQALCLEHSMEYRRSKYHERKTTTRQRNKVTPEQVRELRQRRAAGALLRELSERYGLSLHHVDKIVRRKSWGWVA